MKSDVIIIKNDGSGVREALNAAATVAACKNLSRKEALHLRLLAEEMMGMLKAMTGMPDAEFWIDDCDGVFRLHLRTQTLMNTRLRNQLMSASTTGVNAASKGVMGRIRELFERALEPVDNDLSAVYTPGWSDICSEAEGMGVINSGVWSLRRYKASLETGGTQAEAWDELEKSIVANIADEVEVGIKNGTVELTIYKKFES